MKKSIILAVDAGSYNCKIVGESGELCFPSTMLIAPPNMTKFRNNLGVENKFEVTYNGFTYLIGEHAKFIEKFNRIGIPDTAGGTKNNESALIRTLSSIAKYMDEYYGNDVNEIVVSLGFACPILDSSNDMVVEQITEMLLNNGAPFRIIYNGNSIKITIKDVEVLPEGTMAFFSRSLPDDEVFILDAGSETFNLTAFYEGRPNPLASSTIPLGVNFYLKEYGNQANKYMVQQLTAKIKSLGWTPYANIHICGGYSDQLVVAFNELQNMYEAEMLVPEIVVSRKKKQISPIFASAAGIYFASKIRFGNSRPTQQEV